MSEKDKTQKSLEELNDVFADIANVLMFNGEEVIKQDQLHEANPHTNYSASGKIREQERDVSKFWNNNMIRLAAIGFENETQEDNDMPLRVMSYDGASYRGQFSPKNNNQRYPVISLVLYYGYRHPWTKAKSVHDCLKMDDRIKKYVSDYRMNLFEIAYLTDEQVSLFKSDFKYVADYFVQMRKNGKYIPKEGEIKHVHEILTLMSALTNDNRFEDSYEEVRRKERVNMCSVLDEVENRGIEKGILQQLVKLIARKMAKGKSVYEIADDLDEEIEKVQTIYDVAKEFAPDYDIAAICEKLASEGTAF